jgi:hypothetical protein
MSLIDCEECQHKVSEAALVCPNCGGPVMSEVMVHAVTTHNNHKISGLLFFGPVVWLLLTAWIQGADAVARNFKVAGTIMAVGAAYYVLSEFARMLDEAKLRKRRNQAG